jgi:hypothetical protein
MIHWIRFGHWPQWHINTSGPGDRFSWAIECLLCAHDVEPRFNLRDRLTLFAVAVYAVNIPMAWIFAFAGNGIAAVLTVTIGNIIIWWVVRRLG